MSCYSKITYIEQLNRWIKSNPNKELKKKKKTYVIKSTIKEDQKTT